MGKVQSFSYAVYYSLEFSIENIVHIEDGNVNNVTVTEVVNGKHYPRIVNREKEDFPAVFSKFAKFLYKLNRKEYNKFVKALNPDILDKYFESIYFPKEIK